jgi:hypothetical protein
LHLSCLPIICAKFSSKTDSPTHSAFRNLPNPNAIDIEVSLETEQGAPEATVVADAGLDDADKLEAAVTKAKEDPKTEGTLFDPGASVPKPPIAPG